MTQTVFKARDVTKLYPGVVALDKVDFDITTSEVHILFGENGAGKSTLISMLAGSNTPSSGTLYLDGLPVSFASVKEAQLQGIYTVFQEFSLIPALSVAENMFLTNEPKCGIFINRREMYKQAGENLEQFGFNIDVEATVASLSRAQQQMVEIAKALMGNARILILDEPTASLTNREVIQLFEFIKELKMKGVGIIYISHRTQEFHEIGDRITILRDGKKITTVDLDDTTETELINLMTGRDISEVYPEIIKSQGESILTVDNIVVSGIEKTSFKVKRGEILGVAGLVGSGKSRLWRMIVGIEPTISGKVQLNGVDITNKPTRKILQKGVHYLSSDRKHEGLDLSKEACENLAINLVMENHPKGVSLVNWRKISQESKKISKRIDLHSGFFDKKVSQLSGGNQQKVLFGKCFAHDCNLYILDEPTVGVDMGTRTRIYQLIKSLAEAGKAVVVISSDLPEVMNLSHRLMVLSHGRVAAILENEHIDEKKVLGYFFE